MTEVPDDARGGLHDTVSLEQAAETLGVPVTVMRALVMHQRVPGAYAMGADGWLIPRAAVAAFLAERAAERARQTAERPRP